MADVWHQPRPPAAVRYVLTAPPRSFSHALSDRASSAPPCPPPPPSPLPSGADLGAILSEAQLLAVHDLLDARQVQAEARQAQTSAAADSSGSLESALCSAPPAMITAAAATPTPPAPAAAAVTVTMSHIRRALGVARPSLPAAEPGGSVRSLQEGPRSPTGTRAAGAGR